MWYDYCMLFVQPPPRRLILLVFILSTVYYPDFLPPAFFGFFTWLFIPVTLLIVYLLYKRKELSLHWVDIALLSVAALLALPSILTSIFILLVAASGIRV
jgi:chromate transport protein ChrA